MRAQHERNGWRTVAAVVGLGVLGIGMGGCPAKPPAPPPPPAPLPTPAKKIEKDPAKVLDASRGALRAVLALGYKAEVEGSGVLAKKVASYGADVIAARVQAEGGGWKLYLKGECQPPEAGAPRSEFEIGYDGSTVRSIRPSENAVYEKDNVVEMTELAVFLGGQAAKPPVAWELLDDKPLEVASGVPTFEGEGRADGVACDIVKLAAPTPPAEAGEQGEVEVGLRLFIGQEDHIPRRIERLVTVGGVEGGRVLNLKELKVSTPEAHGVSMVSFVIEAPSDFTHRSVQAALQKGSGDKAAAKAGGEKKLDLAMEPLAVGTPAPDWELKDGDGKPVTLSQYTGKVVVLDFWGTWCPYCLKAMPQVQKVQERYKDKGVVVLGLNTENDRSADPAGFMKQKGYTYGLVLNAEKITRSYRVFGFPTLYVIGRDGKVALVEQGAKPDLFESVSKVIDGDLGL